MESASWGRILHEAKIKRKLFFEIPGERTATWIRHGSYKIGILYHAIETFFNFSLRLAEFSFRFVFAALAHDGRPLEKIFRWARFWHRGAGRLHPGDAVFFVAVQGGGGSRLWDDDVSTRYLPD